MNNPYFTQVAPYMQEDQQGLMPVFQNIAAQQANQNAALQQQMQNNQMAGQTQGSGMGGMNALAMAAMLRKKPNTPATYTGPSYGTNPNFSNSYFDTMSFD
jgi:3-oxoacyl-(acyl-carrier-protein) synthase